MDDQRANQNVVSQSARGITNAVVEVMISKIMSIMLCLGGFRNCEKIKNHKHREPKA